MFIKYSTGQIPPKKSRGKESELEPEPVKKKTASRIVVKMKVTLSADDNIITDDLDAALELAKSISLTEAEEAQSSRKKLGRRSSRGVTIQDTPSTPKPKLATSKPKLKGAQSLTPAEKEVADIMQALKERNKTSKRQPGTKGSSEGISIVPGVPDESIVVFATSSERTGTKPRVPDKENDITEENVILEWGSEQESKYSEEDKLDNEEKDDKEGDADDEGDDHISDTQDTDDEDDETESDEDEIYKYKIRVRKDEDEEILNAEAEYSIKGDAEESDVAKADAEKTEEAKDDYKKAELPLTSSILSMYSCFGDQFLKISSDTSLVGIVKDTTNAEISSLLDIKIQFEVRVPTSVISEPIVLTPVQETSSATPVTVLPFPSVSTTPPAPQQTTTPIPLPPIITDAPTITIAIPESDALSVVQLRVAKLEKDVSELKNVDHFAATMATLKSQVSTVVDNYLGSKLGDALQKALQKHSEDLIQKRFVKPAPESSKVKTPTVNLEKGSEKSALEILKTKKEQAEKQKTPKFTIKSTDNATLKELYHALMEALIEDENVMDKGVDDTVKYYKRKHDDDEDDDDEDPPARPNQASAKELVEEPIAEVVMDDAGEEVVHDDDQPQDASEPKTAKTPNPEWFIQPPRLPTPNPE
ncbi:hypothetical protein Tco_1457329 [Tanacetum coccineum]